MEFPLSVQFIERARAIKAYGVIRPMVKVDLAWWLRWQHAASDEDRSWNWNAIYQECAGSPNRYECYAAFAANELQGLIVLNLNRKQTEHGAAISVDYLATNPANRVSHGGLKFVGLALIAVAVIRSREIGAGGQLWLEVLESACGFYEHLQMRRMPGRSADGYPIYVITTDISQRLLDEMRKRSILEI